MWSASEVFNDNVATVHERKSSISFCKRYDIDEVTLLLKRFLFTDYLDYNTSSFEKGKESSLKPHTYFLFIQDLHGVELIWFFMFHKHNSPEWTSAERLEPVEVIQASCALRKHSKRNWRQQTDDWNALFFACKFCASGILSPWSSE